MAEPIHIPSSAGSMSSLDGISITAIDTDPESNLYMTIAGMQTNGLRVVGILPFRFFGVRPGYLVVSYDRTKDPRADG
jgi:hypothetical protein